MLEDNIAKILISEQEIQKRAAELGQQIVEFCAERIGKKAMAVLEGRVEPPAQADRAFMDNPGPTD